MAERRMLAKSVIDSDDFLDMPAEAQLLYFHLSMRADDDGFITPKKVMRMIGASEDSLKILALKKYVIPFDTGVIAISHWKINNYLRNDRYNETQYKEEKSHLELVNNKYEILELEGRYTSGIPMGYQWYPQDRLGKEREIIEDSFHSSSVGLTPTEKAENAEIGTSPSPGNQPSVIMKSQKNGPLNGNLSLSEEGSVQNETDTVSSLCTKPCDERKQDASGACALPDSASLSGQDSPPFVDDETVPSACPPPEKDTVPYQTIVEAYNSTCKTMPKCTRLSAKRRKSVAVCWKTHGDEIFRGLEKAAASDFLSGRSEDWTGCCFDWLMNSNNMLKVLEGIYDNRGAERKRIERIRRNPLARDYTGQYADDVFPEM